MKRKSIFSFVIVVISLPVILGAPLFELMPWAARREPYLNVSKVSI